MQTSFYFFDVLKITNSVSINWYFAQFMYFHHKTKNQLIINYLHSQCAKLSRNVHNFDIKCAKLCSFTT